MSDDDKKMAVASFKFGVISDFINRQNFSYGEKAKLFREKTSLSYVIPFSSKTTVSKPAIIKWIRDYKKGGQRLEALYPQIRKDRGDFRSLDGTLKLAIIDILKKNPNVIIESSADKTGNILSLNNFIYCKDKYKSSMDLITADGGFDFSMDFNKQEEHITKLLFGQVCYALCMQKPGGSFILKIFDCFMEHTIDILYILSAFYGSK